jgi:hypothetical protein
MSAGRGTYGSVLGSHLNVNPSRTRYGVSAD